MFWLFLSLFFISLALALAYSQWKGAPWMPTPGWRIRAMLRAAALKPGELFVDAGCGDGRVLLLAAREFGARCLGIEIHPLLAWIARQRVRWAGLSERVEIRRENLFSAPLEAADVLFLFLLQGTNLALEQKLRRELRPGTRLVSYAFTLPGFEEIPIPEKDQRHHVYMT